MAIVSHNKLLVPGSGLAAAQSLLPVVSPEPAIEPEGATIVQPETIPLEHPPQ
jgi:hypothetical protein